MRDLDAELRCAISLIESGNVEEGLDRLRTAVGFSAMEEVEDWNPGYLY